MATFDLKGILHNEQEVKYILYFSEMHKLRVNEIESKAGLSSFKIGCYFAILIE